MTQTANKAKETSSLRMILVMGSVGLMASLALVGTFLATAPRIAANRAAYLQESLSKVADPTSTFIPLVAGEDAWRDAQATDIGARVFFGYRGDSLTGLAVEASGSGYQDVIRILYGYNPACECVVGMTVLESKETPGLGDKIEKDAIFLANFEALVVAEDGAPSPVSMVKRGEKTNPWEVDGISGATVSSQAITDMLAASSAALVRDLGRLGFPPVAAPDTTQPDTK